MKLTKLTIVAAVATFALGVSSTKAAIVGTTTDYLRLTFSATVLTNMTPIINTNASVETYRIGAMAVTTQSLLNFMAEWNNTNWPTGAQLIYDWHSSQVCVADSTGTNILFYAGDGIHSSGTNAYFNVEWSYNGGVYNGTYLNKTPGVDVYTEFYLGYFEFYYDDGISSDYVDIYGYGPNTEVYNERWTSTYDIWTGVEIFRLSGAGTLGGSARYSVLLNGGGNAVLNGIIIGTGYGISSTPD